MPIEGGWWSFTPETRYETCPECGGSGMNNGTLDSKCWHCNGTGEVKADDKRSEE